MGFLELLLGKAAIVGVRYMFGYRFPQWIPPPRRYSVIVGVSNLVHFSSHSGVRVRDL